MKTKKIRMVSVLCLFMALSVVGCGKVIQQAEKEKENPAFTVKAQVPISLEGAVSGNEKLPLKSDIYISISAVSLEGARKEESWGKGTLTQKVIKTKTEAGAKIKDSPSSPTETPIIKYDTIAFNKKGVIIDKSDKTWAYGTYDSPAKTWNFIGDKIKRGAPRYSVVVYTGKDTFMMKWITKDEVSQNAEVDLGQITPYDTFIGILMTIRFQESDVSNKEERLFNTLFDKTLYAKLQYKIPKNTTKDFSVTEPLFRFDRELEYDLLTIFDLAQTNLAEAAKFLDELPADRLNKEAREYLKESVASKMKGGKLKEAVPTKNATPGKSKK